MPGYIISDWILCINANAQYTDNSVRRNDSQIFIIFFNYYEQFIIKLLPGKGDREEDGHT